MAKKGETKMHREDSRVVIITGGTGGLGRALAAVYIAKGDHVVVTSRSEAKLREMQSAFAPSKQLHIYK
ncbi:SDR family NAD(P)-dependent oxidoreductase, partial [Microbacteriaceae bacterium K1510]|nr:SDR family NAD(P)-dependent oxidoreductase [Microbacteriaceae bacterium K1510]